MASFPSSSSRISNPTNSCSPKTSPLGQPSPSEAAGVIYLLKDKSIDELRAILTNRDAYINFFHSLDEVKVQSNVQEELRKETLELAKENLEKEPRILELKNQCQIIRATELATAQENLQDLKRQQEEMSRSYSLSSLLQRLQEAASRADGESDVLQRQLFETEIDVATFVQKYKKLRTTYHRRALIHLAARTSIV